MPLWVFAWQGRGELCILLFPDDCVNIILPCLMFFCTMKSRHFPQWRLFVILLAATVLGHGLCEEARLRLRFSLFWTKGVQVWVCVGGVSVVLLCVKSAPRALNVRKKPAYGQ